MFEQACRQQPFKLSFSVLIISGLLTLMVVFNFQPFIKIYQDTYNRCYLKQSPPPQLSPLNRNYMEFRHERYRTN